MLRKPSAFRGRSVPLSCTWILTLGRVLSLDDFDFAVCAIVLAVGALEDEATALREAPLKCCLRFLLRDMIGVTLRQVVEVVQIVGHPLALARNEGEVSDARF